MSPGKHPPRSVRLCMVALALALGTACGEVYCDTGDTGDTADTAYQGARRRAPDAGWRLQIIEPNVDPKTHSTKP